MARISTHVLDIASGRPAVGVRIDLIRSPNDERQLIHSAVSNSDGRTDEPLLSTDALVPGTYELVFSAGDYFRSASTITGQPPVFDEVTIRFEVTDPASNYHMPLLLAANGYTTYRGS